MTRILAWHWVREDRRLGYGDGREVRAGETIEHNGSIALCESGLHASTTILDALTYAPGPVICRVRLSGTVLRGNDKIVATRRETLWMVDARRVLVVWACECAWEALQRVGNPDPRSVAAIHEVMRQQRSGVRDVVRLDSLHVATEVALGQQAKLRAAWDAASAAAWDAARDAASAAAWDAARDAASAAARNAARDAASAAASAVASAVASAAASVAAWAAARDAARDAAWDAAASKRLRRLIGLERRGQLDAEIARLCEAWGVAAERTKEEG